LRWARLQGGEALLEVARLEEVRGRDSDGDEGARPADRVLLTQEVGPHDLEDAPDAFRRVEPGQVIGDRDGALLAPAQASRSARTSGSCASTTTGVFCFEECLLAREAVVGQGRSDRRIRRVSLVP
jgi:hypothetical protein